MTFNVSNTGTTAHEFVVFKTDLAADKLPTTADGLVDEEGAGVTLIDEIEDIAAGASSDLTASLQAGNYVLICNLPGHYVGGMRTALDVN